MSKLVDLSMDLSYKVVLVILAGYKFLHLIIVRRLSTFLKGLIHKKFNAMGIIINGKDSWDIQVHHEKFYERLSVDRSLGLGESYMLGYWDCEWVEEFINKVVTGDMFNWLLFPWQRLAYYLEFDLMNLQTSARAYEVAQKHYDLGNQLFESFLDPSMTYTCGYWRNAKDLTEAQQHKMELIGEKLKLKPGMRVLDIGCGWGGLCKFLAEKYGVSVVGCTVSVEGTKTAQQKCQGLPVDIRCVDYRELDEKFDRIVSVGMFEAVGNQNFDTFFKIVDRCLEDHGLFLLHTIGTDSDKIPRIEGFYNTYIFPNGRLPHATDITQLANRRFTLEDWHNFGQDYNKTLLAWHANFVQNWPTIKHLFKEPTLFYRMWTYYLLFSAGAFKSRKFELWQIVLSKNGLPGGYESVR